MSDAVDPRTQETFSAARELCGWVADQGGHCVLIGGLAVAAHGHSRATSDLDLATLLDPTTQMMAVAGLARARGWKVTWSPPDAEDPLGGVLTVQSEDFDPIQLVNFNHPDRPLPPVADVLTDTEETIEGVPLVSIQGLIALKLYAGGHKSLADVEALLQANPDLDIAGLQALCSRLGLAEELQALLGGE